MLLLPSLNNKSFSNESAENTAACGGLLTAKNSQWLENFPEKMRRIAKLIPADAREKNSYYQKLKYLKALSLGEHSTITTFEIESSLKVNGYLAQLGSTVELLFYFLQARSPSGQYYETGQNPTSSIFRGREILELMQGFFLFVEDYISTHPEVDELWIRTAEIENIERMVPFLTAFGFELLETDASQKNHKKYFRLVVKRTPNDSQLEVKN
ncbi:MAG: hypothetical protein KA116_09135 [Proteobacteria bacterium]|nr:hypothetical protein [Pseudomonadota bacterium]